MWCIPKITDEFIKRMEDVLTLYQKEYDEKEPVLCFDEKSKQLIADTRRLKKTKEGKVRRRDYEYKRNGVQNIFVTTEPKGGHREITVTKRRTKPDFAKEIRRIIDVPRYRNAIKIHIVLDNLNTHFEKSFYETFSQIEAEKLLKRIKFHYTPKHASWLNMAEIEINVLSKQCLNQHIDTLKKMQVKTISWTKHRNKMNIGINWHFTRKKAKVKFKIT